MTHSMVAGLDDVTTLIFLERARHELRHVMVARAAGFIVPGPIWATWLEEGVEGAGGEVSGRSVEEAVRSVASETPAQRRFAIERNAAVTVAGYCLREPYDHHTRDAQATQQLLAWYWCAPAIPLARDLILKRVRHFLTLPRIAAGVNEGADVLSAKGSLTGEEATALCRVHLGQWEGRTFFGTGTTPAGFLVPETMTTGVAA